MNGTRIATLFQRHKAHTTVQHIVAEGGLVLPRSQRADSLRPMFALTDAQNIIWRSLYLLMALCQITLGVLLTLSTRNSIILAIGSMSLFLLWLTVSWLRPASPQRFKKLRNFSSTLIIQMFLIASTLSAGGIENPLWWLCLAPLFLEARHLRTRTSLVHLGFTLSFLFALFLIPTDNNPQPLQTTQEKVVWMAAILGALLFWLLGQLSRWSFGRQTEELKKLYFRQTQKDKLANLQALTSALLHKMGTPLNAAILDVDRELQVTPQNENLKEALISLEKCEDYLRQINMAFENQHLQADEEVDLSKILKAWIENYSAASSFVQSDLRWKGDVQVLLESLEVLIDNALEFSKTCEFRALQKEQLLIFEVIDRGPGFKQEILENWGQPYNSSRGTHHGMGLYNSYLFALSQGGKLSAENLSTGGARVRLEFDLQTSFFAHSAFNTSKLNRGGSHDS